MERLSGFDASFLYIESPTVPLHVCSVIELDTSTIPGGYSSLDRSKPMWEMWVIGGVAGMDAYEGGPLALMIKVHHAVVDGVSAANLLNQLCSPEPDSPPPDPADGPGDATRLEIAAGGLVRFLSRPLRLAKVMPATMSTIVNTVSRARNGTAMTAPFTAPATPFNAEVTHERTIALAQLDLADIKRVKNRFGVKVNDVVMALCAGALREFLRDREELPDKPLVAVVRHRYTTSVIGRPAIRCRGCSAAFKPTSRIRASG
jgi:diacylglycerol O-acyltransferase / wax synthase